MAPARRSFASSLRRGSIRGWEEQTVSRHDDARVLEAARGTARDAALEAALEGVDLYEIEAAWTAFVQEL